jgi:hypothetical protein
MSYAGGREASSAFPDQYRENEAQSRSTSTQNRFSAVSTETGESSKRNSIIAENDASRAPNETPSLQTQTLSNASTTTRDGRGHNRSHKSRGSRGFLLSNPIPEQYTEFTDGPKPLAEVMSRRRESHRHHKGKVAVRSPEKKHTKKNSGIGLGIGGSPLATAVTSAGAEQAENASPLGGDSAQDSVQPVETPGAPTKPISINLDAESAQIVNLALNLSESRRSAARRNISSPLPPTLSGFTEGFAGGSLRQYLQQQRRASRNVSPKPERVDRTFSAPQRTQGPRQESPLQVAFSIRQDGGYQYHFSSSTLARAEKAKKAIELMAQYRRLLQYMPPLKPQATTRVPTNSLPSTALGSPLNSSHQLSRVSSMVASAIPLGRVYNPLQYIRNRKVRARERKALDGESQGFGDIERITHWVDEVAKVSSREGYQTNGRVLVPSFTLPLEEVPAYSSPPSATNRSQAVTAKSRRPRVDWITDPADMLADIYWLEQNENKWLIEDNRERKIFPQNDQAVLGHEEKERSPAEQEAKQEQPDRMPRSDTQFNSQRSNSDRNPNSTRLRGRHRPYKGFHLLDDISKSSHEHHLLRSHRRSSSELSESDQVVSRHTRSATADTHDLSGDILEKQMMEMLAKEAHENELRPLPDTEGTVIMQSIELQSLETHEAIENLGLGLSYKGSAPSIFGKKGGHRRYSSLKQAGGSRPPSNRASLEVPEPYGRSSLEGLDLSVPNSPQTRALRVAAKEFVPSIAMDLSPPHSRRPSPTRKPALARVRSKINTFHDRSRNHSRSQSVSNSAMGDSGDLEAGPEVGRQSLEIPITPDRRKRSTSPPKKRLQHKTDEKSSTSKAGSMRRRAEEIPSGIRGLFKAGRNPVARVSDLLWRKEISPTSAVSSNTSTDDSDLEDNKESSIELSDKVTSPKYSRRYDDDLPVFTSPYKLLSRPEVQRDDVSTESPESDHVNHRKRERRISRFSLLQPPRIDVHNASPSSSPDLAAANRSSRNSDVSDLDDHRRSSYGVQGADARLNAVLGIPGHPAHGIGKFGLLVTGLESPSDGHMTGKEWGIFNGRRPPTPQGPITKREIARVKALLLSSGIKAKEITRRAAELQDLRSADNDPNSPSAYAQIAMLNREPQLIRPVPRSQEHILAARVLSNDIQLSSQMWQASAESFSTDTVGELLDRVGTLQDRITGRNGLSEITRAAEREADDVSRDLVTSQTLKVKELIEKMGTLLRRRRRRFRWLRRAGWVAVEWVLVGVMWWLWLVVMLIRIVQGVIGGIVSGARWLLWL